MEHVHKALLLLAEDDPDQREILGELLSREGYQVLSAASSEEVLVQLGEGPDGILLDVVGVCSPAVIEALRQMARRPVIVLVSADYRLPRMAQELRADAFLLKPYELSDLLDILDRTLLEGSGAVHPSPP